VVSRWQCILHQPHGARTHPALFTLALTQWVPYQQPLHKHGVPHAAKSQLCCGGWPQGKDSVRAVALSTVVCAVDAAVILSLPLVSETRED
jgi:hypothetical protein